MDRKEAVLAAHLDLKGIQYRPEYYEEYFHNLRRLGYNAVLVEYEDVFPFRSAALSLRPEEAWSASFLRHFLNLAAEAGIEVIPLQQSLGHLEYAFRPPENRCYAIPEGGWRDLNPALPSAREWVKGLLVQVLKAHPASRFVHLGMDEAGNFAAFAKASGGDPLDLFLDYLEELCVVCESHGKTPMIWSDMLEDHIAPANIGRLRTFSRRVVLIPWDYAAGSNPQSTVRFSGFRCSRQWLDSPQSAPENAAPPEHSALWFEDWPPEIKDLVADFQISPWLMEPLFQPAVWKKLGFTVWGGAGGSITQDRSVLPYYNRRSANIQLWKQKAELYQLDGLIITEWRRSNSCTVPNVLPDVVWPLLAKAASPEESAQAFFPEVGHLDSLIFKIGKCREGWNIEPSLIEEMSGQQLSGHSQEWRTILLMLRVQHIHKEIARCEERIGCYAGIGRLNEAAWEPLCKQIDELRERLLSLQSEVRQHLAKRYHGQALEEWFYKVFSLPLETLSRLETSIERSIAVFNQRQIGLFFQA